ncbi:MAG: NAD(P)/FAD-dependent oxidoreductase [Chloroflexota bacterium]
MYDVAIVGGGLAGCNAAITLAQRNRRVLLLEANTYPHSKVCGEFLSPECVSLFSESGFLAFLGDLNPVTIRTVRLTASGGSIWTTDFPSPALGISRYVLDAAMAKYAENEGVNVQDGVRVTRITGNLEDSFSLEARTPEGSKTFQAATVIAAHGKRSNLDRSLKRTFLSQHQPYIGLKRHFRGAPMHGRIDLHGFSGGYCGISEIEEGMSNVCLLVRQNVFQSAIDTSRTNLDGFIQWMCTQNSHLNEWMSQATPVDSDWLSIGQIPFVAKTSLEGDVLMVGDAAGMVAPLAGDGMAMALHSGKLAATFIDRYLSQQLTAPELKNQYTCTWNNHFHSRLRLGRVLQSVILRPALLTPGLRLLNLLPALGNFLMTHTRDLALMER